MIEQKYDPQDRPIYPVGSYAEQIVEWLDSNPAYFGALRVGVAVLVGMAISYLLLEWVY